MREKGFTFIELLIVVAIIVILAAVGLLAYDGYTKGAKRNSAEILCKQIIKEVKTKWASCQSGVPCYLKSSNNSVCYAQIMN